jgi:DNA-binding CsgD family transcriptional regulator
MLGQLLEQLPGLNIAAVSLGEFPDSLAAWFIWHGVKSYVNLWEGYEEFCTGMREVRMGNEYIAPRVQQVLDDFPEWPETFTHATKRQMEVLVLICNGFTPERIGETLHISRRTVNWHLLDLYRVFHTQNREELVRVAFTLKLVNRRDLLFYDRDKRTAPLPEWAAVKQKADRRIGEWS